MSHLILEQFSETKEDFESKWPVINFKDVKSGLTCRVSTGNSHAFFTNSLLKVYGELDSRVKPLCHSFRLWAKICKVDRQAAGTLPPHTLFIMVVHYLQQTEPPVLPVIHEKFGEKLIKYVAKEHSDLLADVQKTWEMKNKSPLGKLWLGLLRFYCDYEENEKFIVNIRQKKKLRRVDKSWGKKLLAIEDPFSTKRNVARTVQKNGAYRYIVEHMKVALVYFSYHPDSPPKGIQLEGIGSKNSDQPNLPDSNESKGKIRSQLSRKDADVASSEFAEGEQERDEENGKAGDKDGESGDENAESGDEDDEAGDEDRDRSDNGDDLVDGIFATDTINDSAFSDYDTSATDQSLLNNSSCSADIYKNTSIDPIFYNDVPSGTNERGTPHVNWEKARYRFDDSVLCKGNAPDAKCTFCGEEGHIVENCTAEQVTRMLKPLPPVPDWWFKEILNKVCYCCKDDFAMTENDVKRRQFYLSALEAYITKFLPDARLHLFGSSCNGFGFTGSDMDLCMTLEGKTKDDVNCIDMITWLAGILRKNPECTDVIAITGAKVPIVKFVLRHGKIEADISMYNEVALWNTKLLAAYVNIDKRVHILGCTLKVFVKLCDIGDASKGSLSSYAYVLMLLHFLQQRQPPVLPVLQELYDTPKQPQRIIEGHNCWFYHDLENLSTKWTARNTESCGELWLGFLRYYTEEFDFRRNVVCVRYLKPLTKFEKLWNGRQICIEDPFVLSHNLGAALSLGMVKFIRSVFENARERFGTARRDLPADPLMRQRFFFDPEFLNSGLMPPAGRNCNVCGKIGHWAKECPFNKRNRPEKGQQKAERGPNNKAENSQEKNSQKIPGSKAERGPQVKADNTPQNQAKKGPQSKTGNTQQSKPRDGPERKNEIIQESKGERDQANIDKNKKKKEEKEKMNKKNVNAEGGEKVVQNPISPRADAVYASKLGETPKGQRTEVNPQPQPTVVPNTNPLPLPSPLPNHSHVLQSHPCAPIQMNSPPTMWNHQPLSPPMSPGNPTTVVSPIRPPPSPMSNQRPPTIPGPIQMLPLAYQHPGFYLGNRAPGSPPAQHSSPFRAPAPMLVGPNHAPVFRPPIFSEVPLHMGTVPGSPPQTGPGPFARPFGSPGSPFPSNFIPAGQMFLNTSPPLYQPFGPPPQPHSPGQRPRYPPLTPVPVVGENNVTKAPRVISCEELERGLCVVPSLERDQTDGAKVPVKNAGSSGIVQKEPSADALPSVLEGLRSLNISGFQAAAVIPGQDQTSVYREKEIKCIAGSGVECESADDAYGNKRLHEDFQPPPNVQNIAEEPQGPNMFPSVVQGDQENDVKETQNLNKKENPSQGEAFVFKAEYSEEASRRNRRSRRRSNKGNEQRFEDATDDRKVEENAPPLKDFLVALSRQEQELGKVVDEKEKLQASPLSKVSPQHTQGQQINKQEQVPTKTPDGQGNVKRNSLQHAQKQLQEQEKHKQNPQNNKRQEKTNKSPPQQTRPRQRKPRQMKKQFTNNWQASPPDSRENFVDHQQTQKRRAQFKQNQQPIQHQQQHEGASRPVKSPKGGQPKQSENTYNGETPMNCATGSLVVNVKEDGREVSANGAPQNRNVMVYDNFGKGRRRRKPKNGNTRSSQD